MSEVYAIRMGASGPIKIGYSKDPVSRLKQMQTGCAEKLKIIGTMPGGKLEEKNIHMALSSEKLSGEWFNNSTSVISFLEESMGPLDLWGNIGRLPPPHMALEIAMRGRELGRDSMAVFLIIFSSSENGDVLISQTEVGERLGLMKQNVSRAFKKLKEIGVIAEGRKFGSMKSYKLNPSFGWKGKGSNHIKALQAA